MNIKRKLKIIALSFAGFVCLSVFCLFIKIKYDFPAQKNGLESLNRYIGMKLSKRKVYVRHTGWEDTQSYFKFTATQLEIDSIVKKGNMFKTISKTTPYWVNIYWWDLDINEVAQHYEKLGFGKAWHLYYIPSNKTAFYCFLGT